MKPSPTILEAMDAPQIWRGWFRDRATWEPWRAFLSALFGLPLSEDGKALFRACTGRAEPPEGGINEAWLVCGRRAGKSFVLSMIAVYLVIFRDWRPYLSPGEVGAVKVLAVDRKQAKVIHRYCRALLTKVPAFQTLVERETEDEITLTNGLAIEIQTASFRAVRGYTVIAALCDEISFWRSDETFANPDAEILAALRPAMATIPGSMLLCASSPYARRGELYRAFREHYGKDGAPALVWRAATRVMNGTVPERVIADATERDPANAAAEYQAEFRSDIENFLSRAAIDAVVAPGRRELPRAYGQHYLGFVDPSGGSADSMAIGIVHRDKDGRGIVDCMRERRPPFSPEAVTAEFASLLKDGYGIVTVTGDHYAGEWPKEQFRKYGVECKTSEKTKSEIYQELLPLINSARVELLDEPRLIHQLATLERRTARSGKDSIDHAPGMHDDIANAVAGALVLCAAKPDFNPSPETMRYLRSLPKYHRRSIRV